MGDPSGSRYRRFGVFQLDLRTRELRRNGVKVRVPDQSVQVLAMLLAHPGELVTREEVHQKLWPNGTIVEFDHSINAAIKKLRQALDDSVEAPRYIETLPRLGYRFVAPVEQTPPEDPVPPDKREVNPGDRENEIVSHYRIHKKIGGGGMGVVYKAEDTRLGRIVALKFLPDEFSDDKASLDRFRREGYAASALNHPNICTLYDVGQVDGHPFLAMEFLEGQTLLQLIEAGPLTIDRVFELGTQIADALDAAHGKGIVHRDIKPSNIFITARESVKIMDFGLAKLAPGQTSALAKNADAEELRTTPGSPVGTVAYMSPEQARGGAIDARADLFSFGVVLYEMATGRRPFQGETTAVIFDAILNKAPVRLTHVRPDLPVAFEVIVQKALEKDRDVRCQTASELRADLKRLKRNISSGESETIAGSMPTNPVGRVQVPGPEAAPTPAPVLGRWWPRIAVAIVLVLVAVAGVARFRGRPSETPQAFHQRRLTANPEDLPVDNAAISPDGKYLGYSDHRGIYVQLVGTGETQAMPTPPGFQPGHDTWSFVGWYPDSTRFLASLGVPKRAPSLWSTAILGGVPKKLVEGADDGAVSPDGSSIAYLKEPIGDLFREIWLMGPQGDSPHKILRAAEQSKVGNLKWSPASNRIAYQSFDQTGRFLDSCDLKGAGKTRILSDNQLMYCDWTSPGRLICSRWVEASPVVASNLWELKMDDKTGTPQGRPRRLTDWSGFAVTGMSATADGKYLAFVRATYYKPIFVADVANDGNLLLNPRRLTEDEYANMPTDWTADSREVIFTSNRGGTLGIYKQALDGSAPQNISASLSMDVGVARLSPDGSWIVFNAAPRKFPPVVPSQVYRLAVDGGAAQSLFEARNVVNLSCSGRIANLCVYGSGSDDRRELIFTAFDPIAGKGKELARIPAEADGGYSWMLSPDGSQVAFIKARGNPGQLRFISVRGGETRTVEVKGTFLRSSSIHWASDSHSVFVGTEGADSATLLHVDLKGNVQPIWQQPHRGVIAGTPSPDGRRLAVQTSGSNRNVWLIDNF